MHFGRRAFTRSTAMVNLKDEARRLLDRLPDDASWDDLIHEISVRKAIESGRETVARAEQLPWRKFVAASV
jgi:hypothetical protein